MLPEKTWWAIGMPSEVTRSPITIWGQSPRWSRPVAEGLRGETLRGPLLALEVGGGEVITDKAQIEIGEVAQFGEQMRLDLVFRVCDGIEAPVETVERRGVASFTDLDSRRQLRQARRKTGYRDWVAHDKKVGISLFQRIQRRTELSQAALGYAAAGAGSCPGLAELAWLALGCTWGDRSQVRHRRTPLGSRPY